MRLSGWHADVGFLGCGDGRGGRVRGWGPRPGVIAVGGQRLHCLFGIDLQSALPRRLRLPCPRSFIMSTSLTNNLLVVSILDIV